MSRTTVSLGIGAENRMSIRILVVEDEIGIADFLVRGLSEEGYRVEHAPDGLSGWHAMSAGEFDLILLDWWLPGEDGVQLIRRFRQRNRRTPVLFLTARDAVPQKIEGLDAGANDYLTKPFAFDELLARIRALLRRTEQSEIEMLQYSDVSIDLLKQRAFRKGVAIDLTAKEFALLCLFVRHAGKLLTRTRIFDHVWGDQYDGLSNTLEVHVKELRRKLELHGSRLIQTRRGSGYILDGSASLTQED